LKERFRRFAGEEGFHPQSHPGEKGLVKGGPSFLTLCPIDYRL